MRLHLSKCTYSLKLTYIWGVKLTKSSLAIHPPPGSCVPHERGIEDKALTLSTYVHMYLPRAVAGAIAYEEEEEVAGWLHIYIRVATPQQHQAGQGAKMNK